MGYQTYLKIAYLKTNKNTLKNKKVERLHELTFCSITIAVSIVFVVGLAVNLLSEC